MANLATHEETPIDTGAVAPDHDHRGMNAVVYLLALSVIINYIDRSNLSIAAELIKHELAISDLQLGMLLSAFFWTYCALQIPVGWLVDRFDVKWVFAAGFFLWSAATAATGLLHGFAALIVIRVILGVGESVAFPSYSKIFGTYFKESRRGFANAAIHTGLALGPAVGMLAGGAAIAQIGWRPFFIILGIGGMLWLIPWIRYMPRRPKAVTSSLGPKVRILDIFRQRSAWGTCLGMFCMNYTLYFLVTWLPSYLIRGRHLSIGQMSRVGGFVFFLTAVSSFVTGRLADRWITVGASATRVRKTFIGMGQAMLGVGLAGVSLAPDGLYVWLLAAVGIGLGIAGCNCWAVTQTLAGPRVAGRWAGVQNFAGNLAGAVSPALTGYLLGKTGHFFWPLVISGTVSLTGGLIWVLLVGRVETVDWAKVIQSRSGIDASPLTSAMQP